jgi:ABC-type antimicrobial peptide transport system permease subunit
MGITLTLAARYLGGRRMRALLTTLAVVFGVLVIFGMNILVPTMMRAFQSTMMAASDQVDVTVRLRSGDAFPVDRLDEVRAVRNVQAAQALMARPINLPEDWHDHDPTKADPVSVITIVGLDPDSAPGLRPYPVREGRFLAAADSRTAVIASSLAGPLGLALGSTLVIPTAQGLASFTVVGIRSPRAMPGNEEVMVTPADAQALFDATGMITTIEANLRAKKPALAKETRLAIETRLGTAFTTEVLPEAGNLAVALQTPEGTRDYRVAAIASDFLNAKVATAFISQDNMAADFHRTDDVFIQLNLEKGGAAAAADIRRAAGDHPQFQLFEGKAYFAEMSGLFSTIMPVLYLLFAFMALPALISTLNTLAISVLERTREIGMLRAVGTTRKQVQRIVLAESLLLACFGIAFGLLSGLYLGHLLVRAVIGLGLPCVYAFPWQGIVAALVIGLGVGVLAAIVPSRKAARLEIVEALRFE